MDDYQAGYQAYFAGVAFDDFETYDWRSGWLDAEDDDFDSYDDGYGCHYEGDWA